jgi:hypothetical protein
MNFLVFDSNPMEDENEQLLVILTVRLFSLESRSLAPVLRKSFAQTFVSTFCSSVDRRLVLLVSPFSARFRWLFV